MHKPLDPMSVERTATPSASYVLRRRYGPARHVIAVAGWVTAINLFLQPVAVWAATRNWDGDTDTAWSTSSNWDTAPANDLTTDIANFNLVGPYQAASTPRHPNAGTVSINGITIGSGNGAMTLSGTALSIGASGITIASGAGALTISSPITLGASQSWANNDDDALTVMGAITTGGNTLTIGGSGDTILNGAVAAGAVTKIGNGTATLVASNGYTGATLVSGGKLAISSAGSISSSSAITVNDTTTLAAGVSLANAITLSGGTILAEGDTGSGGVVTIANNKITHAFLSDGMLVLNNNVSNACILLVGGGGGGGGPIAGGGGAGAVVFGTATSISAGTYAAFIGAGGAGGSATSPESSPGIAGTDTTLLGAEAAGGGGGGYYQDDAGDSGGSGGGAGGSQNSTVAGGLANASLSSLGSFTGNIYGNDGGDVTSVRGGGTTEARGGGGAAAAGSDAVAAGPAGDGGAGKQLDIGSYLGYYWGGGGGGGGLSTTGGDGGLGGGGGGEGGSGGSGGTNGLNTGEAGNSTDGGGAGGANTGGGGGGGGWTKKVGGTGGSGIAILSYDYAKHNATVTLSGALSLTAATTSTLDARGSGGQISVTGSLTGSGNLKIASSVAAGGVVTFDTSAKAYSGTTSVENGAKLAIASASSASSSTPITVQSGGTLGIGKATYGDDNIALNGGTLVGETPIVVTGGDITYVNGREIHAFKTTAGGPYTLDFGANSVTGAQILVVGGGGGGSDEIGGGGGGGGVVHVPSASLSGSYSVVVGGGGAAGAPGQDGVDSTFDTGGNQILANGGGGGGNFANVNGRPGGSGGGAGAANSPGLPQGGAASGSSLGTYSGTIYGSRGGNVTVTRVSDTCGRGGGGAGGAGTDGPAAGPGGPGGDGIMIGILGTDYYWGGGGGGGGLGGNGGNGGDGGGGGGCSGSSETPGVGGKYGLNLGGDGVAGNGPGGAGGANTGGGGGGGPWAGDRTGGPGGSGIVVVSFPLDFYLTTTITGDIDVQSTSYLDSKNSTAVLAIQGAMTGAGGINIASESAGGIVSYDTVVKAYGGDTTVLTGATLRLGLNNAMPSGSGNGLCGVGTVDGVSGRTLTVGGTVAPGVSGGVGRLTVTNAAMVMQSNSSLDVTLNGTVAGTGYDQLDLTDTTLNLSAGPALNVTAGFEPDAADLFFIIRLDAGSSCTGTFAGKGEGASFMVGGARYEITYAADADGGTWTGGNDVAVRSLGSSQGGTVFIFR